MDKSSSKRDIFQEKIRRIYGGLSEEVIEALSKERLETFRINPLKISEEEAVRVLRDAGIEVSRGPFKYSYINESLKAGLKISRTDLFETGKVYVQGLSSMMVVDVLKPSPRDKILDLCASPGSKTGYLASLTGEPRKIYAVENNSSRFYSMKRNLFVQGYGEVETIRTDATILPKIRPQYLGHFDKIIADVPCSNEGTIRLFNDDALNTWNPKLPKKIRNLQKRLLASAYSMLKEGGLLVYSTCTYSVEENEEVVDWALKTFPDLAVAQVPMGIAKCRYIHGFDFYGGEAMDKRVSNSIRILPNDFFDGFFIALLQKGYC